MPCRDLTPAKVHVQRTCGTARRAPAPAAGGVTTARVMSRSEAVYERNAWDRVLGNQSPAATSAALHSAALGPTSTVVRPDPATHPVLARRALGCPQATLVANLAGAVRLALPICNVENCNVAEPGSYHHSGVVMPVNKRFLRAA